MVASLRNISARSVTIGQVPVPPTTGVVMRTATVDMTYWAQYSSYASGNSASAIVTGTTEWDAAELGAAGTITDSGKRVTFTGTGGVIGDVDFYPISSFGNWPTVEYLINDTYPINVGVWSNTGSAFAKNTADGGGGPPGWCSFGSNGYITNGFGSTDTTVTFTAGDVIGAVVTSAGSSVQFFKNGTPIDSPSGFYSGIELYTFTSRGTLT